MYLTQSLHRAVLQAPDLPMTVYRDRSRTAREVADRVARLAGGLRGLGVAEGDRVAILAMNSDRYPETFFAAWWTGAMVNPVNVRWSPAEIAYSLQDSGSEVLLIDDAFLPLVPELRARCPQLHTLIYCGEGDHPDGTVSYEGLVTTSEPVDDLRVGGDTPAALVYTGGTTGLPKGVLVTHRALVVSALGTQIQGRNLLSGGILLVSAPLFHIAAIANWVGQNLMVGTSVFLPAFSAEGVLAAVEDHRVTNLALVPTMIQSLVDHPDLTSYDVTSLRAISYGASAIPVAVLERALEAFPGVRFSQGYGQTETTVVSVLTMEDHLAGGARLRSAGRPLAHADVRVVAPDGRELPRGEVGEIVVRGEGLMAGYWNKPDETRQALRNGTMHTGDAGYLDDAGYLFIVDRIKDMIVSGGENVYSAEVENALARHPAVASVAVIGLPDPHWGERVHATVIRRPGHSADEAELRNHTRSLIAGYKVPRSWDFVDALPMSSAGKILKRELRDQYQHRPGAADPNGPDGKPATPHGPPAE
ncbi:long-chain fatty acid--CoA ligase [Streptomyces sp. NPDC047315]|uniref:acyl-CoA synthetase n=1 Tax=Streptomyces sp. NPDC047315 TaxID=3155142 RepID=UPI00340EE20D